MDQIRIMKIYTENKLRDRISVLRMGKMMNQLNDLGEIELTTCQLVLESLLEKRLKNKEFDEWFNKLIEKNGTTEY